MSGKPKHLCKNYRCRSPRNFHPTPAQRALVTRLIGMRMEWLEICKLILHDGHPITKMTLRKHFAHELYVGGAELKSLIVNKFWEKVEAGSDWAIRAGLRNRFRWTFEGATPAPPDVINALEDMGPMQVTFVVPSSKRPEPESRPVVDVSPVRAPDYSLPALEAPRPRRETEYGTYEQPRGAESAFGQPRDPKGWMRCTPLTVVCCNSNKQRHRTSKNPAKWPITIWPSR
jgi:hypothetical protein